MKIGAVIALVALLPGFTLADAKLYLSPAQASFVVGETFEVAVLANTGGSSINAAEAEMSLDPASLQIESISTDDSILATFSTEPMFSNARGIVAFSGWTAEPYAGSDGLLLTIRFKALRTVVSRASLVAGAILAVGESSNIITSMESGLYVVEPERLAPVASEAATSDSSTNEEPLSDADSFPPSAPVLETVPPIEAGKRFAIYGSTEPNMRVWIRVAGPSMEGETAVWSDENGEFSYTSGEIARDGIYRVIAEAESRDGARSEPSERIIVEVKSGGIAGSAAAAAGFLRDVVPFLVVIIGFALILGYVIHRRSRR